MAAPVFKTGFYGTAAIGSNELAITKWSINPKADIVKLKNSKSGQYPAYLPTFSECQCTIDLDWDSANNPFQSPFGVSAGAVLSNVSLYLAQPTKDSMSGPAWTATSFTVESTPQSLDIDGKIVTRITGYMWGTVTAPTP
jgi:hypothetical protein